MTVGHTANTLARTARLVLVGLAAVACAVSPTPTPTPIGSMTPIPTRTAGPTLAPTPTPGQTAQPTPTLAPSPTASATPGLSSTSGYIAFFSGRDGGADVYVMDADGSNQLQLTRFDLSDDCSFADLDLAWSPDGSRIAFTMGCTSHWESEATVLVPGNRQIFVMGADGTNVVNVTNNDVDNCDLAWSPDGSRIAFASPCDGATRKRQIYVINADGSGLARLSDNRASDLNPVWSPDGNRIAFVSVGRPFGFCGDAGLYWCGPSYVYVMNADGSARRNLTKTGPNSWGPVWSPDGTRIAFETTASRPCVELLEGCYGMDREIFVMAADGLGVFNLTNYGFDPRSGDFAQDSGPIWSPDGSRIAFTSYRDGDSDVYLTDTDGSTVAGLTNNGSNDYDPAWSPDGSRIAFVSEHGDHSSIYVMNADGSAVVELTPNWSHYVGYPVWSPVLSQ